eukprot:355782-Chlamydomonas_euryale.AAC.8
MHYQTTSPPPPPPHTYTTALSAKIPPIPTQPGSLTRSAACVTQDEQQPTPEDAKLAEKPRLNNIGPDPQRFAVAEGMLSVRAEGGAKERGGLNGRGERGGGAAVHYGGRHAAGAGIGCQGGGGWTRGERGGAGQVHRGGGHPADAGVGYRRGVGCFGLLVRTQRAKEGWAALGCRCSRSGPRRVGLLCVDDAGEAGQGGGAALRCRCGVGAA